MLKDINLDDLDGVTGGFDACGLASLPALNRRQGLQAADIAYQHARSRGMSAREFNSIGWRKYSENACINGVGRGTPRRNAPFRGTPRGREVPYSDYT